MLRVLMLCSPFSWTELQAWRPAVYNVVELSVGHAGGARFCNAWVMFFAVAGDRLRAQRRLQTLLERKNASHGLFLGGIVAFSSQRVAVPLRWLLTFAGGYATGYANVAWDLLSSSCVVGCHYRNLCLFLPVCVGLSVLLPSRSADR
jgi:hypothetical protein